MIIVEGPDGAGKSTLIAKLNHLRLQVKSLRGGLGGTTRAGWALQGEPAVRAYIRKVHEGLGKEAAYDRFHLSEHVYGPILRHHQELPDAEMHMLNNYLRHAQIPVILCLPTFATTMKNVRIEGRDRPTWQTDAFLLQSYRVWETMQPWATIVYDYEKDEPLVLPRLG